MHKVLKVVSSINVRVSALLLFLLISIGGAGFFQKNQLTESDNSIQSQQALLEYLGLVTQISSEFAEVKYWYADLAVSLSSAAEENAQKALTNLNTHLETLAQTEPEKAHIILQNAKAVKENSLNALDMYFDEDRPAGDNFMGVARKAIAKVDSVLEVLRQDVRLKMTHKNEEVHYSMERSIDITNLQLTSAPVLVLLVSILVMLTVVRPIKRITNAMTRLSGGDKSFNIPGQRKLDEIGDMARAVEIFKQNMLKNDALEEQQMQEQAHKEDVRQQLEQLISEFDNSVSALLAAENMDAVASAIQELSASITTISEQMTQAANIAENASNETGRTRQAVEHLTEASNKVGQVITLINEIAEQINLLALNAAIEAARAGDAGRGFAVVADEIKKLSNQTSKATGEIAKQLNAIQHASSGTAETMERVSEIILEINSISYSVSEAFKEQQAATQDISENAQDQSNRSQDVRDRVESFLGGIRNLN